MERKRPIYESEPKPEGSLNVRAILAELEEVIREFELNIDLDNDHVLAQLLGKDDDDFLDNLVLLAIRSGIDPGQFFTRLNIHLERNS